MGCDIHFYVERRVDGIWVSADKWTPDKYAEEGETRLTVDYDDHFYNGRNYDLFAIFADVRNGNGFAEVDTGDGFKPIASPKGLPSDISEQIFLESEAYGCDGHSHSWHTVADLMAYDWTQTTTKRGWVTAEVFAEWANWNRGKGLGPKEWSGGVGGGNVKHISIDQMQQIVSETVAGRRFWDAKDDLKALRSYYTQISWGIPYWRAGKEFLSEVLPRLWRLGNPEDVRIVFWFDN